VAAKIKIMINANGQGSAIIDGTDFSQALRGFTFSSTVGERPVLDLDFCIDEIEVSSLAESDAEVLVNIPEDVASILLTLGWTPPANDTRTYRMSRPTWEVNDSVTITCTCNVQRWRQHEIGCRNRDERFPFITPTRTALCTCPEDHDPFAMDRHHASCYYNAHSPDAND